MPKINLKNINLYPHPFDENGIASISFLEETNIKQPKEKNIIKQLIESYSVK